ncbi:hypothetical protein [Dyella sp. RRB7]|uniref:hypothetical protein n=1 Tax=Dyella sp. RRB7 TaxID=2919502 RepID=UPI001FAA74AA|nr:hypothetical protein [Dyella sp. RRB7]
MLVASRIEPDHGVLEHWFSREPIVTLDNRTAKEMLILGLDDLVVHFLLGIIHGERRSHGR